MAERPANIIERLSKRRRLAAIVAGLALTLTACATDTDAQSSGQIPETTVTSEATPGPTAGEVETPKEIYPEHTVPATTFWIGEMPDEANNWISNEVLAWDEHPAETFGGVDDPFTRGEDGLPAFTPNYNPYYVALPISEFTEDGLIPGARERSPWADEAAALNDSQSLFKGRWVKIINPANGEVEYGQLIDTGPGDDEAASVDYDYVFGTSEPEYPVGIDLSPALTYALLGEEAEGADLSQVSFGELTWQFVDEQDVPDGPWKQFPPIDNSTNWD